jgi:hypothetical protein
LFVSNPFPGFNCIVTALKSRTVAHKTRDEVPAEVCPGYTMLFLCIGFGPEFEYRATADAGNEASPIPLLAFGPGLLNVKSSQTREFCNERSPERHIFGHPKP